MEDNKVVIGGGNGLFLLFIVFLILKLTGTVTWSWWIITLPLWIGPAFVIGLIGVVLGISLLCIIIYGLILLGIWIYEKFV